MVNFWFTTCNPCVGELSKLDALNKELAEKGGALIGVNTFTLDGDESAIAEAKDVLAKKGATYQNVYFASDGEAGKFTTNIFAYPTTYVVDRSGNIVGDPIVGAITEKKQAETLQKLIEQGGHYNRFKPVHDELKTLKNGWGKKREKFEREHESDLIIWNAANRYLHANLPEGTRSLDIPGWQREYNELKAQTAAEYEELKAARSEVRELQQIRRCIDAAERCEQQEQAPSLKNQIKQNMEL